MRTVRVLAGLLLFGAALAGWAEPSIHLHPDHPNLHVGVPFQLILEITGSSIEKEIVFPEVSGLDIGNRPVTSMTSTQFEFNGLQSTMVKKIIYGYNACATRAGKISIPPIRLEIDGKTVMSEPVMLSVTDGNSNTSSSSVSGTAPAPVLSDNAAQGNAAPPDAPSPSEVTWEDVVYVESAVDKKEVYQGESLLLTLSIGKMDLRGLQVGMLRGQNIALPTTEGFYTAVLQQQSQTRDKRKGWDYGVTQIRIVLCPTVSGKLKIGSWHWEGVGQYRLQQHEFSLDTPPIEITVNPLPPSPAGFSGAVGTFSVEAQPDRMTVMQGTPVRFVIKVTGQGSPDGIGAPALPKVDDAYVSDPEVDAKTVETATGFTAVKTFTYTITPQKTGTLIIPEIPFCYFVPAENNYKTEKTPSFKIEVSASNEIPSPVPQQPISTTKETGHVEVIGDDIHPLMDAAGSLKPVSHWDALPYFTFLAPMLAYAVFFVLMRYKHRLETDQGFARAHGARSKARKRLRHVLDSPEPSEALYRAINGYVADRYNVSEGGMTSSDVVVLLQDHNVLPEISATMEKVLRACERARYAGVPLSRDEMVALTEASIMALDQLESLQKGRRR